MDVSMAPGICRAVHHIMIGSFRSDSEDEISGQALTTPKLASMVIPVLASLSK
jgi:hypothetical protein